MAHWLILVPLATAALLLGAQYIARRRSLKQYASRPQPQSEGMIDEKSSSLKPIEPLKNFKWDQTKPLSHRPFKPIYYMTMALQSSLPSDLIIIDSSYKKGIDYRRDIISKHEGTVIGTVPEGLLPTRELYTHLTQDYLPARYPEMFSVDQAAGRFRNLVTGRSWPVAPPGDPAEILRILGETVEDDLLLLDETPEGHRLVSFVCCHPSGFDTSEKLGKLLREIHGPVPAYDKIGPSMERFFSKLEVGKVVKRLNWAISTKPELFTPTVNHVYDATTVQKDEDVDIETARLRVELQAVSRLPQTRAVLFSFKSYLYPLTEIREEGLGPQLADAIEGLRTGNAPEMWVYKGAIRWGKSVCEYLRS